MCAPVGAGGSDGRKDRSQPCMAETSVEKLITATDSRTQGASA